MIFKRPCPFCKDTCDLKIESRSIEDPDRGKKRSVCYYVSCWFCGCRGPTGGISLPQAVSRWENGVDVRDPEEIEP